MNNYPIKPSIFEFNPFTWDMYDRDYLHTPDQIGEIANHHCKLTWLASLPYIDKSRNAIDIGCRDGEFTRYLHKTFDHVFCFDYRKRKLFNKNVDLSKVTHFKCLLGAENKTLKVSGGSSITNHSISYEKWYNEIMFTLDDFNFQNIDYIKIDVDGYEKNVLIGAHKTVSKNKPVLVLEQENGETSAINYCIKNFKYEIKSWDQDKRNVIMKEKK